MVAVLNLAQSILALAQRRLQVHQSDEAMRLLRRLVGMREVARSTAAEANYLIARIYEQREDYSQARKFAGRAVAIEPDNADYHSFLAQLHEADVDEGNDDEGLYHLAEAAALAQDDGPKQSAYALKLTRLGDRDEGLRRLEATYASHASDPQVVEDFVEGLIEADRHEDAELVLAQANYRRRRGDAHRWGERRLVAHRRERDGGSAPGRRPHILPFRSFGGPEKPRSQKRPAERRSTAKRLGGEGGKESHPPALGPQPIADDVLLAEVLEIMEPAAIGRLYRSLDLAGKTSAKSQRVEIARVLLQRTFLNATVKRLSTESRRLLRTVIEAGGYLPATVLFQNTGPDAPQSDPVQALVEKGLLYFGKSSRRHRLKDRPLIAVIPVDLHERLATVLRIALD